MGWAGLALSAVSAVAQIGQGYAASNEAKYNATLIEGKAGLIDVQKDIEKTQYDKMAGQYLGRSTAGIAKSGVMMSGSPMAALLEQQKQIRIDQAIGQFNLEQEKRYTLEEANALKRQAKQAVVSGYTNAFSTMLQGASSYAMYKGYGQTPKTTFDTSGGATMASSMGRRLITGY